MILSLTTSVTAREVRDWIDGYGVAGPLIFIVVSALLTVGLTPGPLLAGASGLLFGTALGTPVSIVSATLGAVLAFGIARTVGHDAVEHLQGARVQRVRGWVGRRGFVSVLYARLTPGIPYTLFNYAAGLAPLRLGAFTVATAIGCSPRAFAYTALGGSWGNLGSPAAIAAIILLVAFSLAGMVLVRRDRRLATSASPAGGRRHAAGEPVAQRSS